MVLGRAGHGIFLVQSFLIFGTKVLSYIDFGQTSHALLDDIHLLHQKCGIFIFTDALAQLVVEVELIIFDDGLEADISDLARVEVSEFAHLEVVGGDDAMILGIEICLDDFHRTGSLVIRIGSSQYLIEQYHRRLTMALGFYHLEFL